MFKFINSTKGKHRKLLHNGYIYHYYRRQVCGIIEYECEKRKQKICRGKVNFCPQSKTVTVKHVHSHAPEPHRAEAILVMAEAKDRAKTTTESTGNIYGNTLLEHNISDAASAVIAPAHSFARTVQRVRKSQNVVINSNATSAIDIIIPESAKVTKQGERFLLYDEIFESAGPQRIIIFASERGLTTLRSALHWFADGTFKVTP